MRFRILVFALLSSLISGLSAQGPVVLLGVYSFTDYRIGRDTAFAVEYAHPGLNFSRFQTNLRSTGVVNSLKSGTPFLQEPYTSYLFDGWGYAVAFPELRVGDNSIPAGSFFEFSITSADDMYLSLDSVAVDLGSDFTTTFEPSIHYSLWYSVDGKQFFRIGKPVVHTTNSRVYKIKRVLKDFYERPEAQFNGKDKIVFRLAFSIGGVSGSREKHLFIDNVSVYGSVSEILIND